MANFPDLDTQGKNISERLEKELSNKFNSQTINVDYEVALSCGFIITFNVKDTSSPANKPDNAVLKHANDTLDKMNYAGFTGFIRPELV
jgi:hypothetical protein